MRAASRAAGRRARRNTGQATGDRAAMRPVRAASPPCVVGDVPLPTGGGPTGSASSASVRLYGRRPSSAARPRARDPRASLWLRSPRRDRRAAPGNPHHSRLGTPGDLPASPSAPLLRCPGAVTPCAVPLVARSQPRPAPSPVAADPSPAIGLACDASVRRPLAARLPPRSRRRGLGGSPSTCTKARNAAGPWRQAAGRNRGVLARGRGPLLQACLRTPIRIRRGPRRRSRNALLNPAVPASLASQRQSAVLRKKRAADGDLLGCEFRRSLRIPT
jgi:hypothetical protein